MIKIISTDKENKTVLLDLYLVIPTGNNSAGITWASAITAAGVHTTETIESVAYVKRREAYRFSSASLTNAQRLAELTAYHTAAKTQFDTDLKAELKFTGYTIAD